MTSRAGKAGVQHPSEICLEDGASLRRRFRRVAARAGRDAGIGDDEIEVARRR